MQYNWSSRSGSGGWGLVSFGGYQHFSESHSSDSAPFLLVFQGGWGCHDSIYNVGGGGEE